MDPANFSFDSDVECILKRDDKSLPLKFYELASVQDFIHDFREDTPQTIATRKEVFRKLFQEGFISPTAQTKESDVTEWLAKIETHTLSSSVSLTPNFFPSLGAAAASFDGAFAGLPPKFLQFAETIHSKVDRIVKRAVMDSVVRGRPFSKCAVLQLVQDQLRRWFEANPQSLQFFLWQDGRLAPRMEELAGAKYFSQGIALQVVGPKGAQSPAFSSEDMIPLAAVLNRLLFNRGDLNDIGKAMQFAGVRRVLIALDRVGGFVPRNSTEKARDHLGAENQSTKDRLQITMLGHAGAIVDAGHFRVLVDPWLFAADEQFERQPIDASAFGTVDGIVFTHHHEDHMNSATLMKLPRDVPIFVPANLSSPLAPRPDEFLKALGFSDVRTLTPGVSVRISEDLSFEGVSFYGESSDLARFPAICVLIRWRSQNVLFHADSSPDSKGNSIVSTGELKSIVENHGPIALILGTWWQDERFLYRTSALSLFEPEIGEVSSGSGGVRVHFLYVALLARQGRSRTRIARASTGAYGTAVEPVFEDRAFV